MSKEQAKEFMQKVSTDRAAAEKFKEAFRLALVKAGKDTGFKFTREDLDAALTEMKSEIPEAELKGVVGGYCPPTFGICQPKAPPPPPCRPNGNCDPFI